MAYEDMKGIWCSLFAGRALRASCSKFVRLGATATLVRSFLAGPLGACWRGVCPLLTDFFGTFSPAEGLLYEGERGLEMAVESWTTVGCVLGETEEGEPLMN